MGTLKVEPEVEPLLVESLRPRGSEASLGMMWKVLECGSLVVVLRVAEGDGSVVVTVEETTTIFGDVVIGSSTTDVVSNVKVGSGVAMGSKLVGSWASKAGSKQLRTKSDSMLAGKKVSCVRRTNKALDGLVEQE